MLDVFVSYSRKDQEFALQLATSLREAGAEVWIDIEDIHAGTKWSTAVQQGLQQCQLMLVVISPDSMASNNVEDEWQYFTDHKKPVIPLMLRDTEIHFQLSRLQYINFKDRDYTSAFRELHREIRRRGFELNPLNSTADDKQPPPSLAISSPPPPRRAPRWIPVLALLLVFAGVAVFAAVNSGIFGRSTPTEAAFVPTSIGTEVLTQAASDALLTTETEAFTPTRTDTASRTPVPTATHTQTNTAVPNETRTPANTLLISGTAPPPFQPTQCVVKNIGGGMINIYHEPNLDAAVAGVIQNGDVIAAAARTSDDEWYLVDNANRQGWIAMSQLKSARLVNYNVYCNYTPSLNEADVINITGQCTIISATAFLTNIRSQPNVNSASIDQLQVGEFVTPTARSSSGWLQIDHDDKVGWIAGAVVLSNDYCDDLPTVST